MYKKLFCKLTRPVITEDGDFIPKGTPVQVLSWETAQGRTGRVMCRTIVHMFVDDIPEAFEEGWNGNINRGLYIDVKIDDLEYHSMNV